MPGALQLDHLQPYKPILFWKIFNFFTFILGSQFLLPQRANNGRGKFSPTPNMDETEGLRLSPLATFIWTAEYTEGWKWSSQLKAGCGVYNPTRMKTKRRLKTLSRVPTAKIPFRRKSSRWRHDLVSSAQKRDNWSTLVVITTSQSRNLPSDLHLIISCLSLQIVLRSRVYFEVGFVGKNISGKWDNDSSWRTWWYCFLTLFSGFSLLWKSAFKENLLLRYWISVTLFCLTQQTYKEQKLSKWMRHRGFSAFWAFKPAS